MVSIRLLVVVYAGTENLDGVSIGVGNLYYRIYIDVIKNKLELKENKEAERFYKQMIDKLPIERLNPDKEVQREINEIKNKIYVP